MKTKRKLEVTALTPIQTKINGIFLLIVFVIMALPLWNVFVISTSTTMDANSAGLKLWWNHFSIEGYRYVLKVAKVDKAFLNSLYVSTTSTIVLVVLAALAGYILIQKDLPLKTYITSFVLLTMMVPGDLILISIYQLNRQMHLLNTYTGLIVNGLLSGFSILMMRSYFLSTPYSLAESARIDGAGEFRIFWQVYLPLSAPGLATVFFLEFVSKWNSLTIPAAIITDQNMYTLPLLLKSLVVEVNSTRPNTPDNAVMAAIVISTVPLLIIYIFAQRFLISGITLGASKE